MEGFFIVEKIKKRICLLDFYKQMLYSIKHNRIKTGAYMEKIERYQPNIKQGLTAEQINNRKKQGLINQDKSVPTKSIKSIIKTNFFTIFNLMNLCLALAVFAVGEYRNMLFIIVVIINTAISTIQEIHAKHIIDKLSLLSATKVHSIRAGQKQEIAIDEV